MVDIVRRFNLDRVLASDRLLWLGDVKKFVTSLPEKAFFDLVVTSPPYNINKEYEEKIPLDQYLQWQKEIIVEVAKRTSETGSICWQVGNYVESGTKELFPLDIFYYNLFKKHNLILRNRIIWHFEHGLHASKKFSGRYETILWFTKSNTYTFNLDNVRVKAKYPGKRYYKGSKKGEYSSNPKGKNPSDIWKIIEDDWNKEIWNIPNVKANHKEKTIHPCQFPVELVERCILALTNEEDWVLDPFAGVGSTLIGALKHRRNSIGIEKYKKYIKIGEKRIQDFKSGELKIRELGKPIFVPNPNMAVAKTPESFDLK